jgi:hypothetical protein
MSGRGFIRRRVTNSSERCAVLTALAAAVAIVGCQAPGVPTGPTAARVFVSDYEMYFDQALSTLRQHDLQPDRVERPRGIIVTVPTTSAQFFEFWREDARGAYQLAESSLHTMQRVVSIQLEPLDEDARRAALPALPEPPPIENGELRAAAPPPTTQAANEPTPPAGGRFRVVVKVDKLRRSAPPRQITTASGAMGLYNERVPTMAGLRGPSSRGVAWVPEGRDPLLEEYLLGKLTKLPQATVEEIELPTLEPAAPDRAPPATQPAAEDLPPVDPPSLMPE